jgi:hypothetical protein
MISSAIVPSGKRQRVRFNFWLDQVKPEEKLITDWLQSLTKERRFLPTLRAALRLYNDLSQGKTAVLDELFPHVRHIPLQSSGAAPRPLPVSLGKQPDLEIKQATSSADDKPTWNFMISSALSVYGHCKFLPAEIKEYGIRTGRLKPEKVSSGNAKKMIVPQLEPPSFKDDDLVFIS